MTIKVLHVLVISYLTDLYLSHVPHTLMKTLQSASFSLKAKRSLAFKLCCDFCLEQHPPFFLHLLDIWVPLRTQLRVSGLIPDLPQGLPVHLLFYNLIVLSLTSLFYWVLGFLRAKTVHARVKALSWIIQLWSLSSLILSPTKSTRMSKILQSYQAALDLHTSAWQVNTSSWVQICHQVSLPKDFDKVPSRNYCLCL